MPGLTDVGRVSHPEILAAPGATHGNCGTAAPAADRPRSAPDYRPTEPIVVVLSTPQKLLAAVQACKRDQHSDRALPTLPAKPRPVLRRNRCSAFPATARRGAHHHDPKPRDHLAYALTAAP